MLWWQEGNLTLLMSPLSSHLSFWTSVLQLSVAGSCILAVSTSDIHHSIVRCSLGVLKGIPRLFFFSLLWAASPISHVVLPPSCVRPYITGDEREATLSPVLAAGLHLYLLSGCECLAVFDHCVHDDVTDNGWTLCGQHCVCLLTATDTGRGVFGKYPGLLFF